MPMDLAVRTVGLEKRYGERVAVEALDLAVPTGRVTGFVGPNGAGKTTTIRMLLGLIRPTSGTGEVLGRPLDRPAAYLERVGALVDGPAFYPRLSGRANLAVLERLAGTRGGIERALELTGIDDRADDPVGSYSLGMRQRLALAAALLGDPELVVLDEPANGLDPAGIREIRTLLRRLADDGVTVFVSSHQLAELEHVSDHLVLLRAGALVYQGLLSSLLARRAATITARPEHAADLEALARIASDGGGHVRVRDGAVSAAGAGPAASARLNRSAHAAGITLAELTVAAPTLEEIFFGLTEDGAR
ncbi:ATP-binding cassette domain-containing protein [Glycomyces sp. A-F 0318]|uniref:ABC transporter ATP-binding protein n=1 Tax=Glycomyces amatae TaxID=2881355 RepID=UPI001E523F82|nr:ATP-binding cassette domain-containing protein [Glycomyces amatae]MCD0447446.1 ATP-binding cassette domain-containing protein [Glycomyces amatae]